MSEEMKHTQGPLVYVHEVQSNGHGIELLFDTVRDVHTGKNICRMHNEVLAHQFAAAPDMLAVLKGANCDTPTPDFLDWIADRLVSIYEEPDNADFVRSLRSRAVSMRVAIAKAEGRSE